MAPSTPRRSRPASSLLLLGGLLWLTAVGLAAEEPLRLFEAPDRSFRVSLPGAARVRVVEDEDRRRVWAAELGRAGYWFSYAVIPRAATMSDDELLGGLDTFATGYQSSSEVRLTKRTPVQLGSRPGLEVVGTGGRGAHRALFFAVGERVFTLATEGVPESETRRYWRSFQVAQP